jgi:5-methyltetrahydropteroyltriglutamate--homocysteine methyltransferase
MKPSDHRILTMHDDSLIRPPELLDAAAALKANPFGSWHVPHVADAPLDAVVPFMLKVRAGAYSIEAANAPPLASSTRPRARMARLGERPVAARQGADSRRRHASHDHRRAPARGGDRLVRFARLVGRQNLIAGTESGVAQTEGLQRVHPQVMWAKLEALVEGARLATGNCGAANS